MKYLSQKDQISLANGNIQVCFGASGSYKIHSIIPIKQIRQIELNDRTKTGYFDLDITVTDSVTSKRVTLDRFDNQLVAEQALLTVKRKLKLFNLGSQFERTFKGVIVWLYIPIMAFITILILNYFISIVVSSMGLEYPHSNKPIENDITQIIENKSNKVDINSIQKLPVSNEQLLSILKDGVNGDKFTINLTHKKVVTDNASRSSIYVFSDPLCPHCKKLEYQLNKLSNTFDIYLFPVSIIGKEKSAEKISYALCQPQGLSRSQAWSKIIDGEPISGDDCNTGRLALEANNKIFNVMNFLGTPTIISSKGNLFPINKPFTAEEIGYWATYN